jgi:hypothetical protein
VAAFVWRGFIGELGELLALGVTVAMREEEDWEECLVWMESPSLECWELTSRMKLLVVLGAGVVVWLGSWMSICMGWGGGDGVGGGGVGYVEQLVTVLRRCPVG